MLRGVISNKKRQESRDTGEFMAKPEETYQCQTVNCGCLYDPDRGDRRGKIAKGTCFRELPEDWKCPVCGAGKRMFRPLRGPGSVAEEGR
jgi:rubredoxin